MNDSPRGLVGVRPRDPIGVAVTVGVKGESGAPTMKDRFFMMAPMASSHEFGKANKYKALARDPHPSFVDWNELAKVKGKPGRVAALRGNLVHADLASAAWWNRSAQKLPEPHANPASMSPACEGNGIEAKRYAGVEDGVERYETIACPNELCPFAMSGCCKPSAHLIFRLRWNPADPFEAGFPSLLALYNTRGWNTLRRLLGLFELVLGTEAVAPFEPRENWRTGLAQELGLQSVSLVGMPFTLTVGEKTNPAKQTRFPVVSFSPDGDLVEWLVAQRRQRDAIGGGQRIALPAAPLPITTEDPEFEEIRYNAAAELTVTSFEIVEEAPPTIRPEPTPRATDPAPPSSRRDDAPALVSQVKAKNLLAMADQKGCRAELLAEAARIAGTGDLAGVPAGHETALMAFVARWKAPKKP